MLKLEDINKNAQIAGLETGSVVRVITTEPVGDDAVTVYYKTADGRLLERMLFRSDEANLSLAEAGRPWAFDAPAADFKLVTEAYRINLAHLFDPMMAVHTSSVEPLPHQITAVYEFLLPRQPMRGLLADDPGAGKTIMAGLYIRELLIRADTRKVLIVAPGSLVEQWQDEMYEKFGLSFTLFSREQVEQSHSGNPFDDFDLIIARVDQLARSEELQQKLALVRWDLVVVDEAHKLSANYFGNKVNKTRRFQLGELLGANSRHFLLMTATPHNGKDEDFQLFLSLLDSDRFYGKARDGVHKVDVSDMMRRMVKEELLKFDGTPLFPERRAYTVNYRLSDLEAALYQEVTTYVKEEMNKADRLQDGKRRGSVGFALTLLQRRLASSPEAIYQSLRRRHERLKRRVEEEKLAQRGLGGRRGDPGGGTGRPGHRSPDRPGASGRDPDPSGPGGPGPGGGAFGAGPQMGRTVAPLAGQPRDEGRHRPTAQADPLLRAPGYPELPARPDFGAAGAAGGHPHHPRRGVQELFRNDPEARVLVATDAAGEGVNLQNANLMVNYDLPWNPNRLEQRFGRIHRIGQTEVCHLWNMVADETREGDVFQRLFEKIEMERQALGGRVRSSGRRVCATF